MWFENLWHIQRVFRPWALGLLVAVGAGCAVGSRTAGGMDAHIRDRAETAPASAHRSSVPIGSAPEIHNDGTRAAGKQSHAEAIATINGVTIPRQRVVDLLLASHGVGVLEQVIGLEAARGMIRERGLVVTRPDIEAERIRSLKRLIDPLASVTPDSSDREQSERVLERILSERNISEGEFDMVLERNAYLRKIIESQISFTDDQLRDEMERAYGERVRVRHIQLATSGEVARLRERLLNREDFAELAIRFSANRASAERGGLLEPFSRNDDRLPLAFREAAFSLRDGEVSDPIRIGEWLHVIRLEERLPAEYRDVDTVRPELEARLHDRLVEPAMFDLYEKLFDRATIRIHDPVLRSAFDRKHPGRLR